jgi:hypothetical protein
MILISFAMFSQAIFIHNVFSDRLMTFSID